MTLRVFSSSKPDFTVNEKRMYNRLLNSLHSHLDDSEDTYYLVVDHIIGTNQLDLLIIKKNAVISIDMKAYSGNITGNENGDWSCDNDGTIVEIKRTKNPFKQCKDHRFAVMRLLSQKLKAIEPRFNEQAVDHISSGVCFLAGMSFDENQIDENNRLWFFVTDEENLGSFLEEADSNQFLLREWEIIKLLESMNLKEVIVEDDDKVKIDTRNTLSTEDSGSITDIIKEKFGDAPFTLNDLASIADSESAVRYLKDHIGTGVKETKDKEDRVAYNLNEDELPETIPENIEVEDTQRIRKIAGDKFALKPVKKPVIGKEYLGVYRGAIYHFNHHGKFWFNAGRGIRIPLELGDSKIVDSLLEIKPLGGSFRITESNEVIVKVFFDDEGYNEIFVGMFKGLIKYEGLEWNPKNLSKGDLWPAPYTGTTLSVNSNRDVGIKINTGNGLGVQKVMASEGHEKLADMVLSLKGKGDGGRIRLTENGHIITLLEKIPYPPKVRKQLENLTEEAKNIINIRQQTNGNEMVPVYIGKFKGNITFRPPFDLKKKWSEDDIDDFLRSFS